MQMRVPSVGRCVDGCMDGSARTTLKKKEEQRIFPPVQDRRLTNRPSKFAEPQVFPDQAEAGQVPEAEPSHPAMDPPPNWQHDQVRTARIERTGPADEKPHYGRRGRCEVRKEGRNRHTDQTPTQFTDITPREGTGARLVSASRRLVACPPSPPLSCLPPRPSICSTPTGRFTGILFASSYRRYWQEQRTTRRWITSIRRRASFHGGQAGGHQYRMGDQGVMIWGGEPMDGIRNDSLSSRPASSF